MKKNSFNTRRGTIVAGLFLAIAWPGFGCSATPVGFAVSMAGKAVNDIDAQERSKELVGTSVANADGKLGAPVEVFSDTRGSRTWRLYNVPNDVLNTSRYLTEVEGGRVIAVSKVEQYSDPVAYAATLAVLEPKVMGKSPSECEANLGMGPSLLTVRSNNTGQTIRIYDARVVKELQSPHYCVLRFGASNTCEKINLVEASTPSRDGLAG